MLEENLQKIIELRHNAPYAVLGPHYSESDRALTIRAFLPGVARAWIVPADGTVQREMQRLHPDGLFALRLAGIKPLDYQLRTTDPTGQTVTFPDPYAIHEPAFTRADGQALHQGQLADLYHRIGARAHTQQGQSGINFTLWAPNASRVSVVGTFNQWDGRRHPLERHESGVWEIFIPGLGLGELYKYEIRNGEGAVFLKTDPLALQTEIYPKTAAFTCGHWNSRAGRCRSPFTGSRLTRRWVTARCGIRCYRR